MTMKRSITAAALLAALTLGATSPAVASVYAGSRLLIDDLTIDVTNLAAGANPRFTFTTSSSANLNGSETGSSVTCGNVAGSAACGGVPLILGSTSSEGTPTRNPGDFTFFGPSFGQTYANASSEIQDAELITGSPTIANQISETEIAGSGFGITETDLSSETRLTFTFTVGEATGDLTLSFKAAPNLFVAVDTPDLVDALATARLDASFNLVGTGGQQVSWSPSGATGSGAGAGIGDCLGVLECKVTESGLRLNSVTRTLPAGNPASNSFGGDRDTPEFQLYTFQVTGLTAGDWTLSLASSTFAQARQEVPEPATMLLLGTGLVGLGMVAVRRRRITGS